MLKKKYVLQNVATFLGVILLIFLVFWVWRGRRNASSKVASPTQKEYGKCNPHSCGAVDPVSNPDYNMTEVITQSILLEDHLENKRRNCHDCIFKHMLFIQGLVHENVCLAGNTVDKYPYMKECPEVYKRIFDMWRNNKDDDKNKQNVLTELRAMRKKLMEAYLK